MLCASTNLLNTSVCVAAAAAIAAGAFCTRNYVIGTGAVSYNPSVLPPAVVADSGSFMRFYSFGFTNTAVTGGGVGVTNPIGLAQATLIGESVKVTFPNGTSIKDSLRVNGAAVRANCQL
jgi:hypothetical protein